MLRNKTLFVVGAGASYEVDLPLGPALADKISAKLQFEFEYGGFKKGDYELFGAFKKQFSDNEALNCHFRACRRIRDGIRLARSIDNYIDTHRDDQEVKLCGKIAITDCIAASEKGSKLYFDPHTSNVKFDTDRLAKTWLSEFVSLLFEGVPKSNVAAVFDDVSIVCFNYDRCIQQALLLALHTLYHLDLEFCHELIDKLRIVYPYGSLGPLPRQSRPNSIGFGAEIHKSRLFEISENIRTYSEQTSDNKLMAQISSEIKDAETVVFLGCAYHPQNIRLLTVAGPSLEKKILGTAYGLSDDAVARVTTRLLEAFLASSLSTSNYEKVSQKFIQKRVTLKNNLKCFEFMNEYRQTLLKY